MKEIMKTWKPRMRGAKYVDVYLDGKKIDRCFLCIGSEIPGKTVNGEVAYYAKNQNGSLIIINEQPARVQACGKVRWEWQPDTPEEFVCESQ